MEDDVYWNNITKRLEKYMDIPLYKMGFEAGYKQGLLDATVVKK